MVRVPCGAFWRKFRCIAALASIWIYLVVFAPTHFGETRAKTKNSHNGNQGRSRLVTLPSQRMESSMIPDSFLESIPNISLYSYRYIVQPVYDVTCGVLPTAKQKSDQRYAAAERLFHHNRRHMLALFLVHSKADHFLYREAIRDTWGSEGDRLSRVVFILGNPYNASCQTLIEEESEQFGDILQGDFHETYRNITQKAIMALKWASLCCPRAGFVVKVDDDIFVGRKKIVATIVKNVLPKRGLLLCKPTSHSPVLRGGKYAVAKTLYSADQWPTFCFGGGWIASRDVIMSLYKMSLDTRQIHLDDVYVTGILRMKIKQKINRASVKERVFCHSQGRPELVKMWWDYEKGNTADENASKEKWLDCFH